MPSLRTIHFAILLAAAFCISATAAPVSFEYMDYSDPPLRTTSIAKRDSGVEVQNNVARALIPVQRYGEYGYQPADAALYEGLQQIMDRGVKSIDMTGEAPCM
ncbi:hypothetical protein PENSPDRAFT_691494 [Peniophora sp. CONT]|nr:hypothetical protein PENSPDRAFT_691494 [Peniophora sp. CONT]